MSQTMYDATDNRLQGLQTQVQNQVPGNATLGQAQNAIYAIYYSGTGVTRTGEVASAAAYHAAIEAAITSLNAPQILYQETNRHMPPIAANQIATTLDGDGEAWIHVIKQPGVDAASRLYIPANLGTAVNFFPLLWNYGALQAFKICGYGRATTSADVIVAWFQHGTHASAVGTTLQQNNAQWLSGSHPIGSYACAGTGPCGYASEYGSSVGTDVINDMTAWWQRNVQVQPQAAPVLAPAKTTTCCILM